MPYDQSRKPRAKNGTAKAELAPRVLVVSGGHDDVTQVLDDYAACYIRDTRSQGAVHVRNADVTAIHQVLETHRDAAIFFFLHGRLKPPGVVLGQSEDEVIGTKNAKLLKSRIICGTCYSLNGFAKMAVARGSTVIGYDGVMFVATKQQMACDMEEAALAAQRALNAGEQAASAAGRARDAYVNLADKWYNLTIDGQVHAAAAQSNSDAVGVKGSGTARLPRLREENRGRASKKNEIKNAK
jgi:hypothetical protein